MLYLVHTALRVLPSLHTFLWLQKDSIANELDVTQDLINPMARYVEKWGAQLPFGLDEDVMSDMMATVGMC